MELPATKPSKKTRIEMALRAVTTVDAMRGTHRSTTNPLQKRAWMDETWNHPQVHAWCGMDAAPNLEFLDGSGTYRFGRFTGAELAYWFGRQPMTDTDLASAFAYGGRYAGWPHGSRKAAGIVHDGEMTMLTVIALWVHNPARAKELHDMYGELKINVATPVGGWDPATWTAAI